jgi:hypothetical protein
VGGGWGWVLLGNGGRMVEDRLVRDFGNVHILGQRKSVKRDQRFLEVNMATCLVLVESPWSEM